MSRLHPHVWDQDRQDPLTHASRYDGALILFGLAIMAVSVWADFIIRRVA